mmetsp:Transcript_27474/g.24355  ORF Transcript_27474/g.24355 Transcript_27474/m.24355 type:complete len:133 (-) Transcript_27474:1505-1903(-)
MVGPVSKNFYWFGLGDTSVANVTTILKTDATGAQIFAKTYNLSSYPTSFVVDSIEAYAYFVDGTGGPLRLAEIDCTTGLFHRDLSSTDFSTSDVNGRINPIPNSAGFIFSGNSISEGSFVICKFAGGSSPLE